MAEVGRVLGGRYRLIELLGQGGMATIFRAQDARLGRDVAVKVLRAEYGTDEAFVARFRQEAQSAAALNHPSVVNVFDVGTDEAGPFIVMELLPGGDLAQVLREQGTLDVAAAVRVAQQIAEALGAAHGRGIVHRDIKPSNVLLTSTGRVKVGDFGIAQAFSDAQLTLPGMTMGSVHYFSPEQARGEPLAPSSDIYALGLVMFEMLTGRRAWTGDTAASVAVARLSGAVPSPAAVHPGIPAELDGLVRWALSPDPDARPTAEELATRLERFATGGGGGESVPLGATKVATSMSAAGLPVAGVVYGGAPPPPREDGSDGGPGRWGWLAAILGLLVLVAAGILLFLVLGGGRGATDPAPTPQLVLVPELVGRTVADARSAASVAQLVLAESYEQTEDVASDTVLSQDPQSNTEVQAGSVVNVVVATVSETVAVPDLRNASEAQLVAALQGADLAPGARREAFDAQVAAGAVIGTDPRAGITVVRGTVVDYTLSLGPEPTPSPTPTPSPSPSPSPTPAPTPTPTPSPTFSPTPVPSPSP
ncbi:MAG: Stk1 family PASTA domain-containing Ser/Thr kinase, partial [Chloroflexota bacterium]|nr:Stk1 family PASTA domain-containing Ser/Thr kinase [Chloroflexota bacterium]